MLGLETKDIPNSSQTLLSAELLDIYYSCVVWVYHCKNCWVISINITSARVN